MPGIEILFARYQDAVRTLQESMHRQVNTELQLRVADAEVDMAERMCTAAEEALFEVL